MVHNNQANVPHLNQQKESIYYPYPNGSSITAFTCRKAAILASNKLSLDIQKCYTFPPELDCVDALCKITLPSLSPSDFYNLDDQEKVFASYLLKHAKIDRTLKSGRFECTDKDSLKAYVVDARTSKIEWQQLLESSDILGEMYRYGVCSLFISNWAKTALTSMIQTDKLPNHSFTAVSLGTMTGKVLIIQCNYPGEAYKLGKEIPGEVISLLESQQVVKCGFGLIGESRLKSLGIILKNVVDLSNLTVLAFPQPDIAPLFMENTLKYYLYKADSPVVVPTIARGAGKYSLRTQRAEGVNLLVDPDKSDFSRPYAEWSKNMKLFMKVVHHGSLSIPVAMAVKAVIQERLGEATNIMPHVHWILASVENQTRFGGKSRANAKVAMPFGITSVKQIKMYERSMTAFYLHAPSAFLRPGPAILRTMQSYERKYALDFHGIDPEFANGLQKILGPLEFVTQSALMRMIFKKSNSCAHACSHCGSPEHEAPTLECLAKVQRCIYPQCLEVGHNVGNCPMVMTRCRSCRKLGHVSKHHDKPFPQLMMEFVLASLLHYQGYMICNNVKIAFVENGINARGESKYQIVVNHISKKSLSSMPVDPKPDKPFPL